MGRAPVQRYRLGCCAMPSKMSSLPMQTILRTLIEVGGFELVEFTEDHLLRRDTSEWPRVDCLIAFYSRGYPLDKVLRYVLETNPIVLNDINMQFILRNRREVLKRLDAAGIPTPRHIVVDHEAVKRGETRLDEYEDFFVYDGKRMDKPFIEKPQDADDHNNYVYYPTNAGGGCKKLFRKLADRSSEYYADITKIRRDGVFVYEEFLSTLGTDIKVYTVGPMFGHAEARKSPTLDGKVQRTVNGKEERYPVLLSDEEKWIAYMVVEVFKQTVCGFDILRTTTGRAVVCDVNGWSFVKGNAKYYLDCAHILSSMFLNAVRKRRGLQMSSFPFRRNTAEHFFYRGGNSAKCRSWQSIADPPVTYVSSPNTPVIPQPSCILDEIDRDEIPCHLLPDVSCGEGSMDLDDEQCLSEVRDSLWALESACDRQQELQTIVVVMRHADRTPKQKLKFLTRCQSVINLFRSRQRVDGQVKVVKLRTSQDLIYFERINNEILTTEQLSPEARSNHLQVQSLLSTKEFIEINRKVQLVVPKGAKLSADNRVPEELMIVVKWGGELTPFGLASSEKLGHDLRELMYPGESDGLLRLHSTFRHDFKIYTSDEGRCQLTAAAFTKGFLDLEGDLPPILVQMVARDERAQELFEEGEYTKTVKACKSFIQMLVHTVE
eukprot:Gregarina_sp_Poly_1__4256@NODE_231_length_11106_cov_68_912130_g204_i0_p2_GENE_NODE_231_length_11106_cov_68_912130_g204_i0NODE_231_length_11106_cov_68_912130_g204_i0_p2_ORF_typecomplete_len662_score83_43His_Phos_2/PF00328_22/4_1e40PPIP5K2_N/PF18086_1/6_8e27RimK/PF08443_11/2_7e14ATPgrasp_3/PF02655_14/0_023_NODE_231_length_11106_cov_68_912130_g204_i060278012